MKPLQILIVLLIAFTLLRFIRAGADFHIAKILPFCDGQPVNIYHWAGLIIVAIFCWGLMRLFRQNNDE